jgi:hypothetical protein
VSQYRCHVFEVISVYSFVKVTEAIAAEFSKSMKTLSQLQSLRDSNDVSPSATDKRPRPSDFYDHESDPQRLNSKRVSASPIIEVVLELELICPKAESSKAGNASGTGTYDPHAVTNRMKNISESSYPIPVTIPVHVPISIPVHHSQSHFYSFVSTRLTTSFGQSQAYSCGREVVL